MSKNEEEYLKHQEHIKEILNDVTGLIENRYVLNSLRELLKPNEEITNNVFFDHYVLNYVSRMTSGVRIQVDKKTSLGGLRKLLENIENNPDVVTQEMYLLPYKNGGDVMVAVGERFWAEKFGGGKIIDVNIIRSDIALLDSVTTKVKDFVDKRVAHKDKEWAEYELTYGELDKAVDILEELTIKYNGLFTGSGMEKLLPTFHYDWEDIFRYPCVK